MSKRMEISNPMLECAMELIKKNNTPANTKVFIDELTHAKLLSHVIITPEPEIGENGMPKITEDTKINMPMVSTADGKKYIAAYTALSEIRPIKVKGHLSLIPFSIKQYVMMVAKEKDNCDGMILNPYSSGMILNKETLVAIIASLQKKKSGNAAETKNTEAAEMDDAEKAVAEKIAAELEAAESEQ